MLNHLSTEIRTRLQLLLQDQRHRCGKRCWDFSLRKELRGMFNRLLPCTPLLRWEGSSLQWHPSLLDLLLKSDLGLGYNVGQRLHLLQLFAGRLHDLPRGRDHLLRTLARGRSDALGFAFRLLLSRGGCQLLRCPLLVLQECGHRSLGARNSSSMALQGLCAQACKAVDHCCLIGVALMHLGVQRMRCRGAEHVNARRGKAISKEVQQIESRPAPLQLRLERLARDFRCCRQCRQLSRLQGPVLSSALKGRGGRALHRRSRPWHLAAMLGPTGWTD
mmetsp:Transcript_29341/g.74042  ORF Transcript_29341/g.74042 Transcript_29341/m.74042 type:complete len:276 (-) Transcript_29341:35-862(-)